MMYRHFTWLFLLATGCTSLKDAPKPEVVSSNLPSQWQVKASAESVANGWIADFGDAQLTKLVLEAIVNNPDLSATAARLDQAVARARAAGALLFPTLDLNGGASRNYHFHRSSTERRTGIDRSNSSLGASLDLSWEVDIWGRVRYRKEGFTKNAEASAADLMAARQSLAAQVAKAWFAAAEARLQQELAHKFVTTYSETLRIVQARQRAGSVTQQDVANTRADLALARQRAETTDRTFSETVRGLEVLLGRYPAADLQVSDDLRAVPPAIPAGLPSELLERRPDVVAAEKRVAAAFNFSQEADAARLPRVALTSSIGTSSSALSELIDPRNAVANFAANLFAPLFDAGLRRAQLDEANAQRREAAAAYRSVALQAFEEVENLLQSEGSLAREEELLRDAATQYETTRRIAETRYKAGQIDLTDVLTIQRQELQAKSNLLSVRNQRLAQRINLHLALGGDFHGTSPATAKQSAN